MFNLEFVVFDFIENTFATPVILSLPFYFLVYSYIGNSISMSEIIGFNRCTSIAFGIALALTSYAYTTIQPIAT